MTQTAAALRLAACVLVPLAIALAIGAAVS